MPGIFRKDRFSLTDKSTERMGPASGAAEVALPAMTGTESQLQWAVQIRRSVGQEFDRVAQVLHGAARKQSERDRVETCAMIAILEEKRSEVMANGRAGYFIREWQELNGRVRETIARDPRFQAIKATREARRRATGEAAPSEGKD